MLGARLEPQRPDRRRDRKLFEIEIDGKGDELAPEDPRRRPTFRFDVGDVDRARAMIVFQRAAVELVLAYRWSRVPDATFDIGRMLDDPSRHSRRLAGFALRATRSPAAPGSAGSFDLA